MSPFTQLTSTLGYGGGIDRDFSPILNYIDEFDRHFSRHHRFMNCFIPRFDLEEDAHNYYLYGDLPGATVNDITVEAHDNHTLVVYGTTKRPGPVAPQDETPGTERDEFVKVQVEDHEHPAEQQQTTGQTGPSGSEEITQAPVQTNFPPPPRHGSAGNLHHQRQSTYTGPGQNLQGEHRVLLNERLVGEFHRTFAFPAPVEEENVRASMENGVVCIVVPKKGKGEEMKRGRRVPIIHGNFWKGEEKGSGFGFASGAV